MVTAVELILLVLFLIVDFLTKGSSNLNTSENLRYEWWHMEKMKSLKDKSFYTLSTPYTSDDASCVVSRWDCDISAALSRRGKPRYIWFHGLLENLWHKHKNKLKEGSYLSASVVFTLLCFGLWCNLEENNVITVVLALLYFGVCCFGGVGADGGVVNWGKTPGACTKLSVF